MKRAFVTGFAGFIGSHLCDRLLHEGYKVVGIDNFSTGKRENIKHIEKDVDILQADITQSLVIYPEPEIVFHLAAMGSVPRSIEHPDETIKNNVYGSTNVLFNAVKKGVKKVILASSSSVYGDIPDHYKTEPRIGAPLSPYAASERSMEIIAETFHRTYGIEIVNLRFFNVFGPRQNKVGPYAPVIAKWSELEEIEIFGSGFQSRDYTYVSNVVDAMMLAATTPVKYATLNVGCGEAITLNGLADLMGKDNRKYLPFRAGDVVNSIADIANARTVLGYEPRVSLYEGLHKLRSFEDGKG